MSESITYTPGHVVWRELMTHNVTAAKAFYGKLFGWQFNDITMQDGQAYTMVTTPTGKEVAGIMAAPTGTDDMPPVWYSYVSVPDVDACAKRVTDAGGTVVQGPQDIPGQGRFVAFTDPQGALSCAFTSVLGDAPHDPKAKPGTGEFCWEHLNSTDPQGATSFWSQVYPWTLAEWHGQQVFNAPDDCGAVSLSEAPEGTPSHMATYVVVDSLATAQTQLTELGGQHLMGPLPVAHIGFFSVITDPQGAMLCLFEPKAQE